MHEHVNLFKALPVKQHVEGFSMDFISQGALVEKSVVIEHGKDVIDGIIRKLIPSDSELNKTFHKSWRKVRDASMEQLVIEQLINYFTTYGFEQLGVYDGDTVFVPDEELRLTAVGGITFVVIRGITVEEIDERVRALLTSGVALPDDDLSDLIAVIKEHGLQIVPDASNNREMRIRLYDLMRVTPEDPVEYLRLQVYRVTDSSMLIKSPDVLNRLKAVKINVFRDYEKEHGLIPLARVFNRFKPMFLALKNMRSATTVNRIRKLAARHHEPMPEDYIASVTKHIRAGTLDIDRLSASLKTTSPFRKVKLAQALRFYAGDVPCGVVYSIRNGKSFATRTQPINDGGLALRTVIMSLCSDLRHLEGKRVCLDAKLVAPTSGKMFFGDVPVGSHFSTDGSLVVGVSWHDVGKHRVDLDLSVTSVSGKTGWDGDYRNRSFLFSGDMTAAPRGATEAHLIRKDARDGVYVFNLNYFNGFGLPDVPFTLFVAGEGSFEKHRASVVSQDDMKFWARSTIDGKHRQKTVGVLRIVDGVKTFYLFEAKSGTGMSARAGQKNLDTISFYEKYLDSLVDMHSLLQSVGAKIVDDPADADVDLSLASLTKDAFISLFHYDE